LPFGQLDRLASISHRSGRRLCCAPYAGRGREGREGNKRGVAGEWDGGVRREGRREEKGVNTFEKGWREGGRKV